MTKATYSGNSIVLIPTHLGEGGKGGSLEDSNTSETPNHKISEMNLIKHGSRYWSPEARWWAHKVIQGKCITLRKEISVRTPLTLQFGCFSAATICQRFQLSVCFPSWATVFKSARAGGGPGLGVAVEGSRQALRALATSVKTRRLGLCVVLCEVVRVCGGYVTVSYADTRPRAAGHSRRSEPTPCWVRLKRRWISWDQTAR